MKEAIFCFISFIFILSTAQSCDASTVAYIYSTDSSSANAYRSLLEPSGFATDLILTGNISATDFSNYDLMIIANDVLGVEIPDFNKINNSGKPIIGLGFGGSYFFESLGLVTNYGQSWVGSFTSIIVMDRNQTLFKKPKSIVIPKNKIIQLYSPGPDLEVLAVYLPEVPPNVTVLGMEILSDEKHYSLTLENSKYMHWGFTASPTYMTQTGKDLFINSVNFLVPLTVPTPAQTSTPNSTPIPAPGMTGFETVLAITSLFAISYLIRK